MDRHLAFADDALFAEEFRCTTVKDFFSHLSVIWSIRREHEQ